jgi:hypothetical protein
VFNPDLIKLGLSREEWLRYLKALLDAHKSKTLFQINDYYFLILYHLIYDICDLHNDGAVKITGVGKKTRLHPEHLIEDFFGDVDFTFNPNDYAKLTKDAKEFARFSEGIFGVVNRLKPAPEEMVIIPFAEIEGAHRT